MRTNNAATASRMASLRTQVVKEGGYDLEALSTNVQHYFKGLNG